MCQTLIQLSQPPKRGILSFTDEITKNERDAVWWKQTQIHPRAAPGISCRGTFRDTSLASCPAEDLTWKRRWLPHQSPGQDRDSLHLRLSCSSTRQSPLQSLLKHGVLPSSSLPHQPLPTHRLKVSGSVGLGGGPGACLSHKPPGMLVQGSHFEKACSRASFWSGSESMTASPSCCCC